MISRRSIWTSRNAANFNEAGYFACYLNLAIALILVKTKKLIDLRVLILVLGVFSTLSTAGLHCTCFYSNFLFIFHIKIKNTIFFNTAFFILISYTAFNSLDFLSDKLKYQYSTQQLPFYKILGRFGATLENFRDIQKSPIIGKGLIKQTRFDRQENWDSFNKPYGNLNSWTDTWVRLGSIGFILFMGWYIVSLRKYSCLL